MTQNNLKLSKDLGDNGDQLSQKPIYIYHIPGVKVGSAYNVKRRAMEQGYDVEDIEIICRIIPNAMSFNHIWRTLSRLKHGSVDTMMNMTVKGLL